MTGRLTASGFPLASPADLRELREEADERLERLCFATAVSPEAEARRWVGIGRERLLIARLDADLAEAER